MYPIIFKAFGIPFYSYAIFLGLALGMGIELTVFLFRSYTNHSVTKVRGILFVFVTSAWIGAKIFFAIFSVEKEKIIFNEGSFWLGGGFVFYGAVIAIILVLALMIKVFKIINLRDCGLFVPGITLAHAIGRVGCFFAGCCFGHSKYLLFFKSHPVQLYESGALFILGIIFFKKIKEMESGGNIFFQYLFSYSVVRFILEFFRGDLIRGSHGLLSTSQWVSLIIFVVLLINVTRLRIRRRNILNIFF